MSPEVESQVLAADESRYQALYAADTAALENMLAENYLHTHANGKVEDKAQFLASIAAARFRFINAHRTEQRLRRAGFVVLLSGRTETTVAVAGETKVLANAFVTVWVQVGSGWKLLHWQATKLPDA